MGEVVNLRTVRKRKTRAERERLAEENRIRHGRTRAERERIRRVEEADLARHERHRLSDDGK